MGVTEVLESDVLERERSEDLAGEAAGVPMGVTAGVPGGVAASSPETASMAWTSISAVLRVI